MNVGGAVVGGAVSGVVAIDTIVVGGRVVDVIVVVVVELGWAAMVDDDEVDVLVDDDRAMVVLEVVVAATVVDVEVDVEVLVNPVVVLVELVELDGPEVLEVLEELVDVWAGDAMGEMTPRSTASNVMRVSLGVRAVRFDGRGGI